MVQAHPGQDGVERFSIRNDTIGVEKHVPLSRYIEVFGAGQCAELFKFAVLRNPWDRAMSHYFSPHLGKHCWDRDVFMDLVDEIPTLRDFIGLNREEEESLDKNVDALLRFEHLDDDFASVCEVIQIPQRTLTRRNVSGKPHYRTFYDDETAGRVAERFAEEIALGKYRFGQ